MATKICQICKKEYCRLPRRNMKWWIQSKYCSVICSAKSKIGKPSGMLGKSAWNKGQKLSEEHRIKLTFAKDNFIPWNKGKKGEYTVMWSGEGMNSFKRKMSGQNNPKWIFDRSKLVKRQERNDSAYKNWRMSVWIRDGFKCRILNDDCNGRIEAHHILGWSLYPELRYEINNGITLCHAHHPRVRAEEKRLTPQFQELVAVSK